MFKISSISKNGNLPPSESKFILFDFLVEPFPIAEDDEGTVGVNLCLHIVFFDVFEEILPF